MNAKFMPGTTEATTTEKQQQQQQQQTRQLRLIPTVSTTPTTATSTSATLTTINFPMKKKRKLSSTQTTTGVRTLKCQSDSSKPTNLATVAPVTTSPVNSEWMSEKSLGICLRGDKITQEMRAILKAATAAPKTSQKSVTAAAAAATATATHDAADSCSSNICLICRQQHETKCCLSCCHRQYLLPLGATTATTRGHCTTDDSFKHCNCSCSHSCCQQRHQRHVNYCHYTPLQTAGLLTRPLKHHQQKCACPVISPPPSPSTLTSMTSVKHSNESNINKIDELSKCCCSNCCQQHSIQMTSSSSVVAMENSLATNITKQRSLDSWTNDNQILPTAATSYFSCFFLNALKTFQLLIFFMQAKVLLPQQLFTTRWRQQQQRPPFTRLRFRSNSYVATSSTTTSRKDHHRQQQQQGQRLPATCRRHFYRQQSNYSVLYIILIILSFLSLILPSTQAQTPAPSTLMLPPSHQHHRPEVSLSRSETVCKSMDLRNTPDSLQQLRNCTVIEGFLLITLMNTCASGSSGACNASEFNETFPLLTEVTEFIFIYRVHHLRSLSQLFPNLSIIRGRTRFEGYALVVYSNPHLEDLGLAKLLTISNGGVRIEDNLSLCFVETVDWSQIVTNTTDVVIQKNRAVIECQRCPGDNKINNQDGVDKDKDVGCKERNGRRHCWNSNSCQKFCPDRCRGNCLDENTCCNESCIGGCAAHNLNVCTSCRHYSIYNNSCTDTCPLKFYSYLERRCITREACTAIGFKFENNREEQLVAFNQSCTALCPENYNKINNTCQKCGNNCVKRCQGGLIDSATRAKDFHGCTHIIETGLIISIRRGGKHLMKDLEFGLSSIQVIETYLKVHRTYGMFSLEFFKNLREISGKSLCEERFALYVLENNDMESIWLPDQVVRIEEGRVFFHFNPKLCYSTIEKLLPMLKNGSAFDKNEVATDSNGSKGACNPEFLNTTVISTGGTVAFIEIVNPLSFEDARTFIGYQYFYIEDKYGNATKHSNRPCDDGWNADEPTKDTKHIYTHLQPYTQYAYYVKTMTISSEPRNAQSPIQHFKTKSAQPDLVNKLDAQSISSSKITIYWQPPKFVHGKLIKYRVRAVLDRNTQKSESRDYCKDPLKEAAKIETPTHQPVPEKPVSSDCKCQKDKDGDYEEFSDARVHDVITFENTVQDFIYVKQSNKTHKQNSKYPERLDDGTGNNIKTRRRRSEDNIFDSFLMRHMRATPDENPKLSSDTSSSTSSSTTTSTTIIPPTVETSSNNTKNNKTSDWIDVNATRTEYTFENLKHFSVYMLGVEACREREPNETAFEKECSDEQIKFVRTNKKDDVDKVENVEVELLTNTSTTRNDVRVRWQAPLDPNGGVVSYTISYLSSAQDSVEERKCIREKDYHNSTGSYVYILKGLPSGNYSIRVQANSLAGEGVYSERKYIFIPATQISSTMIAIICIVVLIFISLIAGIVYYLRKKLIEPPSNLKIFPTVNPYYISLQYIPDDWEVPRDRIIQLSALGQGSFGMVYEGILKNYNNSNEDTPCAIKTVNENATDRERANFLNEASVMKQFDTYHVVRLLGVCSRGQPALVIMELMKNGDLKSYLRAHRPDERDELGVVNELPVQPPPLSRIYQMAIEIADGMAYLAAKKFVHRDLAARNCMVASDLTVKIGDFGMTRDIYETDYYRKGTKGLLPVRWMPPESLRDGVYSSASDVFSYGVVLWEMATLASQPYQGLSNDQVLRYVIDGGVMERPENCPDKLYRLMQKCWHHRPSARPSFMDIIRLLLDLADPHFKEVSFFHSEEGQQVRNKELQESFQKTGDVFTDHDNDMDDVTTPLRVGEYNDYKLNMDNNSSVENHNESPMVIDDDHPHSPYSLGSAIIISSTPDGQSKNSFNLSQMSHNNPTLSSAPSTSAGLVSSGGGGFSTHHLHHPHQRHPQSRFPQQHPQGDDAVYVQPDYNAHDFEEDDEITLGGNIAKSVDTDDRPYEIYDPSPNYREHAPYDAEDEEFDALPLSGGQNLLPKQRSKQRLPTIMPISSSMPDDVIGGVPMSSSLHPSTASAASSNASSTATGGASASGIGGVGSGMGGKYPSLKKAVTDTVQSVGHSLVPQWRNINRLFNHKRSGSNASHKSTSSNPTSSNSNSNLSHAGVTSGIGRGQIIGGSTLGTIESGGSGSTGSYAPAAPRFFTSHTSDNPNYQLLDETANASGISVVDSGTTPSKTSTAVPPSTKTKSKSSGGFSSSSNPTYQLLNESLNTTASPTKPTLAPTSSAAFSTSENPNYELMQAPPSTLTTSDNPNYVMMNEPEAQDTQRAGRGILSAMPPPANLSENPNYQIMGPPPVPVSSTSVYSTPKAATPLRRAPSTERHSAGGNSHSSRSTSASASASSSTDEDVGATEGIKMERIPLSRKNQRSTSSERKGGGDGDSNESRSRSQSEAKTAEIVTGPTIQAVSTSNKLKEMWLRDQQQQQTKLPPPNGFIGREG